MKFFWILIFIIISNNECAKAQSLFEDTIEIQRKISIEDILSGGAAIDIDKEGNFIVTNKKSKKVSIYNSDGELLFRYGRIGKGPGDFLQPVTTIKLSSGQLLTGELTGKLSLFNARGDSVIKIYNVDILPLAEIHQIDKSKILLVGRKRFGEQIKLLHIFDLTKGVIIKSVLELPFSIQDYGGVFGSLASLPTAAVKDEKIAVVIAPFPNINIYDFNAEFIRSINLSLEHFKNIKKVDRRLSPQKLDTYITTFSMIEKIFWLDNNTFLISYFRFTDFKFPKIMERQNSLANIKLDGSLLFEIKETPMLKSVHSSHLYFEDRDVTNEVDLTEGVILNN